MNKKIGLLATIGIGILAASITLAAIPASAVPISAAASTSATSTVKYQDVDVVGFLVFGVGPIAQDRPELLTKLNITRVPQAPAATIKTLLTGLQSVDPDFHKNVTVNAQARDPYKAQLALTNFSTDMTALTEKEQALHPDQLRSLSTAAAGNGSVWAFTNYVVSTQVAVTAAAAVSVLAVLAALVVFLYQHPKDGSTLIMQDDASALGAL
ncbi:hypothetical protein E3O44_09095 [Cryobacterium algoricola]|uniref:Antimicrobial peptide, SdpC family n=1 Tax=Cryobacterium algoricola TaxID=1259183 RepID=A0ABY2ICG3_9MICO|nr:hypothetical protein [Cryobacterium algoricola]TFB87271.1 hypothetical protein E3O44_09095 [Cryobacterium algoricola]